MEKVAQGANYSIDLQKRTLKVNGKVIIENGMCDGLKIVEKEDDTDNCIETIEKLYQVYKHSIPSEKTDSRRRNYFYALKEEDLSDDDMLYGERRMTAMFALECFILTSVISGSLRWKDDWGWFWQSEADKDLVIIRSWVVGE